DHGSDKRSHRVHSPGEAAVNCVLAAGDSALFLRPGIGYFFLLSLLSCCGLCLIEIIVLLNSHVKPPEIKSKILYQQISGQIAPWLLAAAISNQEIGLYVHSCVRIVGVVLLYAVLVALSGQALWKGPQEFMEAHAPWQKVTTASEVI